MSCLYSWPSVSVGSVSFEYGGQTVPHLFIYGTSAFVEFDNQGDPGNILTHLATIGPL